jgi:hypothetical protein
MKKRMNNGVEQVHVVCPKFKNGEAVVRNVKVQQNVGMYVVMIKNIKLISLSSLNPIGHILTGLQIGRWGKLGIWTVSPFVI